MTNLTILSSLLTNLDKKETEEPRSMITLADHVHEKPLTSTLFGEIGLSDSNSSITNCDASAEETLLKRLVKAMTAPDTIDLIYNKLLSM